MSSRKLRLDWLAVERLPAVGQQLVEAALRPPRGHLAQYVGEIGQGRHTILRAGAEQTVERGSAAGGRVRSSKEIVFPAEREVAELLLADIVVETEPPVVDKPRQRRPVVQEVARRVEGE